MSRFPRIVASVLAALTLSTAIAPAFAGGREEARKERREDTKKSFPVDAKVFHTRLEARITRHLEALTKRLDHHGVPEAKRRVILAQADKGAKVLRAAAAEAEKDGTVTKDEAKLIREVAQAERKRVRELLPDDMKKAGKGHKRGKGKGR